MLNEVVLDGTLPATSKVISISTHDVNELIGFNLSTDEIDTIFNRLGFTTNITGEDFEVTVPSRQQ